MGSKRLGRISEEIKKIVSIILSNQIKDPRVSPFTSITEVQVTSDLRYAKIYVSILGSDKEKEETLKGLQSATGFIRKEIGSKIKLRYIPEPIFYLDNSIEHGIHIMKLIEKTKKDREDRGNLNE